MRRLECRSFSSLVILFMLAFQGCATLQTWLGQPQLETYTFNYDGRDFSAFLPEQVLMPPETARQYPQCFWNTVCVLHVIYDAGIHPHPDLPVASFWFTQDIGVFGLVWHTLEPDGTVKHEGWLYVKGLPIGTTTELFDEMLDDLLTKPSTPGA